MSGDVLKVGVTVNAVKVEEGLEILGRTNMTWGCCCGECVLFSGWVFEIKLVP